MKPDVQRDQQLARLAARQHGVVATAQLRAIGFTAQAIHRRIQAGRLHRLHRGVYAVGHARISLRGRWMAATLACGPGAVLSHRAAAALWGLCATFWGPIDVSAPTRHDIPGIRCHLVRRLRPDDATTRDGIPVTAVNRTLLDLAEVLRPQPLRTTLEAAQRLDLLDPKRLQEFCARSPGRHGLKPLRAALQDLHDEAPWTQSGLERRFLELVREAGLPEPQTNVFVAGEVVDCYWPQHRLVVEVDSFKFHKTRRSFEADRRKDAKLQMTGIRVARFTDERIDQHPRALVRDLDRLLAA